MVNKGVARGREGATESILSGKHNFKGSSYHDEGNENSQNILLCVVHHGSLFAASLRDFLHEAARLFLELDLCFFYMQHSVETSSEVPRLYSGFISMDSAPEVID